MRFHAEVICIFSIALTATTEPVSGQCTWYTITVNDGVDAADVTWELIDAMGVTWTSGIAPWMEDICLPDGCYTLLMYDSSGDGWEDVDWVIEDWTGDFDFDTNLGDGPHGTDTFVLGEDQPCDPANNTGCPIGTNTLQFIVTNGTAPAQVSWELTWNGTMIQAGGAGYNDTLCLSDGCYVLYMTDIAGNGWNGATYTLKYFGGSVLYTGTLGSGDLDSVLVSVGGAICSWGEGGGGGPIPGGGCGTVVNSGQPGSDCPTVICVCDPFTFQITPSGSGSIDEIPPAGSVSNPAFGGGVPSPPWGGLDYGCLLAGELNSSWIRFTVGTDGNLAFGFGLAGQQTGFYDWAMWPYTGGATCSSIADDLLPPVRCVWNAVSYGGTGLANVTPPGGSPGNFAPELAVTAGQQFIVCLSNWSFVTTSVTLEFFGSATISCVPVVLPVELLAFGSNCTGTHTTLLWSTASEHLNERFDVEQSADGAEWSVVGSVTGAGCSQQRIDYAFNLPEQPEHGTYYRLRQVDLDGIERLSKTIYAQPCGMDLVVRQWLVDRTGRLCDGWKGSTSSLASGVYVLNTEYRDGRTFSEKIAILQP